MDIDRLRLEKEVMEEKFPQFRLKRINDGRLGWMGTITTNSQNAYDIMILYGEDYPYNAPECYVINPKIPESTPHMYSNNRLCLYYPNDPYQWTRKSTAIVIIGWAAGWLHAYEYWSETGYWPGDSAD